MAPSTSGMAVTAGIALFVLAGYQTLRYRDMLKLTQEEFETVPAHVIVEVLLAAALCMWGSVQLAGAFKPISALANQEGLDANVFRPDFMSFNHRGHAVPLAVEPLNTAAKKNK
ncbi:g3431 [Coccomyxa elongata]